MKLRDVAVRFRPRPPGPLTGVSLESQFACLADLRRELTATYPSILADRLIGITRDHGLDRFPEGFLVRGLLDDRGPTGARTFLRQIRRNLPGHDGSFHPLFSNEFYRLTNPDVAAAGAPPWAHYQVFGRAENRTPHPFIDVSFLAAAVPETSRGSVVDEYLMSPDAWLADPSPYVDAQKFVLHGNWDGVTNPLVQIVDKGLNAPWIHGRLLLIDSSAGNPDAARLTAVGYLLSRSTGRSRLSAVETWSTTQVGRVEWPSTLTVVPGFFVGGAGQVLAAPSAQMVSPDSTIIALPTEFLGVRSGATVSATFLQFVDRRLDHDELRTVVSEAAPKSAIAPFSRAQADALRDLVASEGRADLAVLDYGVQVRVTTGGLGTTVNEETRAPLPAWPTGDQTNPTHIAFVVDATAAAAAMQNPPVAEAVRAGAALCLLDASSLAPWRPVLRTRAVVVCSASTLDTVLTFVDREHVFLLSEATAA